MLVIPAIDLREGKVVGASFKACWASDYLLQNPVDAVHFWEDQGAQLITLSISDVTLGVGNNFPDIQEIISASQSNYRWGKKNLKSILRYTLGQQHWNPFSPEPVEFAPLNFDFHPTTVRAWLTECGFVSDTWLTVSHFRINLLKRVLPLRLLVWMDSLLQPTGSWLQLTPSIFVRSRVTGTAIPAVEGSFFKCPGCGAPLDDTPPEIVCPSCKMSFPVADGIYDFRIKPA